MHRSKFTKGSIAGFIILLVLGALTAFLLLNYKSFDLVAFQEKLFRNAIQVGECKPTFEVELSQSSVSVSELAASNCYDKLNRDDCLEVDVYSATTDNFLTKDGIIDCEWIRN